MTLNYRYLSLSLSLSLSLCPSLPLSLICSPSLSLSLSLSHTLPFISSPLSLSSILFLFFFFQIIIFFCSLCFLYHVLIIWKSLFNAVCNVSKYYALLKKCYYSTIYIHMFICLYVCICIFFFFYSLWDRRCCDVFHMNGSRGERWTRLTYMAASSTTPSRSSRRPSASSGEEPHTHMFTSGSQSLCFTCYFNIRDIITNISINLYLYR